MIQVLLMEVFFPSHLVFLGNINQSLMTLRTCIEVLRENQLYGLNKVGSPALVILGCDHLKYKERLRITHRDSPWPLFPADGSIPRFQTDSPLQELFRWRRESSDDRVCESHG